MELCAPCEDQRYVIWTSAPTAKLLDQAPCHEDLSGCSHWIPRRLPALRPGAQLAPAQSRGLSHLFLEPTQRSIVVSCCACVEVGKDNLRSIFLQLRYHPELEGLKCHGSLGIILFARTFLQQYQQGGSPQHVPVVLVRVALSCLVETGATLA